MRPDPWRDRSWPFEPPARRFVNASSQYLHVATPVVTGVPLTMACWINQATSAGLRVAMSIGASANADNYFNIGLGTLLPYARAANVSIGTANGPSTPAIGKWAHVAAVFAATNSRTCYVNGIAGSTNTTSITPAGVDKTAVAAFVRDSGFFNAPDATILSPAIWNVALNVQEIRAIATGTPPWQIRPQNLVACPDLATLDDPYLNLRWSANGNPALAEPIRFARRNRVSVATFSAPAPQTITVPTIATAITVNAPTVVPGATAVAAPTITAAASVSAPAVVAGPTSVSVPTISTGEAVSPPTVTPGAATVTVPTIAVPITVTPPGVGAISQSVEPPAITIRVEVTPPAIYVSDLVDTIEQPVAVKSLLQRFLDIYDALYAGDKPWQWANGMGSTLGECWCRPAGGYLLYRGDPGSIDYRTPVGATSPTSATPSRIGHYPTFPLRPDTEYAFAVRAVGRGGAEELNTRQVLLIRTDSEGEPIGLAPNPPIGVSALPQAGGKFLLRWRVSTIGEQTKAAAWNVYHDAGSGTIDYDTPIGSATSHKFLTAAYTDALTVRFAVRAASRAGVEELNTHWVEATADAGGPLDMAAPVLAAGRET